MNGLEQVKQTVAGALNQAGLAVRTAFEPGWAARCDGPVAAVGLRTGESRGGAMGRYLGQTPDRREVYGLQLELTLSIDLYSPAELGAPGCDSALETLHQVMLSGLPAGLKPAELRWEETVWDEDTAMFVRRGSLSCGAYFTAEASEDGVLLTDFILKGVVRK
ncbi:MAG: hypothetical protein HFF64_04635 [Oscillospiraceae bacterium]|nr:hypothetical protein [Oscillospiraceae bacterium]